MSEHGFGPTFEEGKDGVRLRTQMHLVRDYMLDATMNAQPFRLPDGKWTWGGWRTLADLAAALNTPEASASAQLRHLRKPHLCHRALGLPEGQTYRVEKRRREGLPGTWEYRVLPPTPRSTIQRPLFPQADARTNA